MLCLAWGIAQVNSFFTETRSSVWLKIHLVRRCDHLLVNFKLVSLRHPSVSEWDACDRPLGLWSALWLIRVVLASALAY
jgi:hypothetical protein